MDTRALVASFALPAALTAQVPDGFAAAWARVADRFQHSPNGEGIVGAALLFVHDGRPIAREFRGVGDLDSNRPVDESTIWHWASCTKTLTGIALMQLRDRDRLRLEDPIAGFVPELRRVHDPFASLDKMTLQHLLSHSAGFRGPTWPWGGDQPWHPHEPTEWSQLVAMLPYTAIEFEPGSRYSYSNPGIVFLGQVIERLTGDDYEVYTDKNLLKPLAMHESYFDHTPYHLLARRANNYTVRAGKPAPNGLDFDTGITVSNGGLNAPLADMVRYVTFLMGSADAELQKVHDGVLARASLDEMWQPRLRTTPGGKQSMGLTFFVTGEPGARAVGHTGGQKAFTTFFWVDPEARTAALFACNTVGLPGGKPQTGALSAELQTMLQSEVLPLFRTPR